MASPAWILSNAILDPSGTYSEAWDHFVDAMPDRPEQCLGVFNTTNVLDGRLMSGRTVIKPGVQLRARAKQTSSLGAAEAAHAKLQSLLTWLDTVKRLLVVDGDDVYMIHAVRQSSGILPLGMTEDNLFECTANVVLSLTKEE